MSYAGPASRGKRALEIADATPAAADPGSQQATAGAHPQTSSPPRAYPYDRSSRGRSAAFTAGVVLGTLVGVGIALLVAPQSGADTRRELVRRSRRATRRGRDAWADLRDELQRAARRRWRRHQRNAATEAP